MLNTEFMESFIIVYFLLLNFSVQQLLLLKNLFLKLYIQLIYPSIDLIILRLKVCPLIPNLLLIRQRMSPVLLNHPNQFLYDICQDSGYIVLYLFAEHFL